MKLKNSTTYSTAPFFVTLFEACRIIQIRQNYAGNIRKTLKLQIKIKISLILQ